MGFIGLFGAVIGGITATIFVIILVTFLSMALYTFLYLSYEKHHKKHIIKIMNWDYNNYIKN